MDCPICGLRLILDCIDSWEYEGYCEDCKKTFKISLEEATD